MKTLVTGSVGPRAAFVAVLLSAVALGACRGENLFSLPGSVTPDGPQVTITAPGDGLTVAPGDSILVLAEISAPAGIGDISYEGTYADGSDAYIAEDGTGDGAAFLQATNYLNAVAGQEAGDVYVKVSANDLAGAIGLDSVKISIVSLN